MQKQLDALSQFVVGTEGNVSLRTSNGFDIKRSGTRLAECDLISCDISGAALQQNTGKPSMEVAFHSMIYRNSDYTFIAHTHPTNVLKILCSEERIVRLFAHQRLFPDQVVFNAQSACVVEYGTPGVELATAIDKAARECPSFPSLFLLRNHGIICCGYSMEEVLVMTEICDKAAEVFLGSVNTSFLIYGQRVAIVDHDGELYRRHSIRD